MVIMENIDLKEQDLILSLKRYCFKNPFYIKHQRNGKIKKLSQSIVTRSIEAIHCDRQE